jgi:hypothetical protein
MNKICRELAFIFFLVCPLLGLSACSMIGGTAEFPSRAYQTFSWDTESIDDFESEYAVERSTIVKMYELTRASLLEKGYEHQKIGGSFLVTFSIGANAPKDNSYSPLGYLQIELIDRNSRETLWRTYAKKTLNDLRSGSGEDDIKSAIDNILTSLPPNKF